MRTDTLLKRDSNTGVFLWKLRNFKITLFYRTPPVAASRSLALTINEKRIKAHKQRVLCQIIYLLCTWLITNNETLIVSLGNKTKNSSCYSWNFLHIMFAFHINVFFYKKHFYKKMNLKNPKMLRKSPASNAWPSIFKNADFC